MWDSNDENLWKNALTKYWDRDMKPEIRALEYRMDCLDPYRVKDMSVNEFYEFLYNEYFVWKYTAPNRLATTRRQLSRYQLEKKLYELESIHRELFQFDQGDAVQGLTILRRINGLGTAGASGLLALLFPKQFGTVDQFVVKALMKVENLPQRTEVQKIDPLCISIKAGALLIEILKEKDRMLNATNKTEFWTPRKIDMVLWASRNNQM